MSWFVYLLGALLALSLRFYGSWRRLAFERRGSLRETFSDAASGFLRLTFVPPAGQRGPSVVVTIGVVWVLGGLVVSRSSVLPFSDHIPHLAGCFLLGSLAEALAPPLADSLCKRVLSMLGKG